MPLIVIVSQKKLAKKLSARNSDTGCGEQWNTREKEKYKFQETYTYE